MKNIFIHGDEFTELWGMDFVNNVVYTTAQKLKDAVPNDDVLLLCLANGGNWFFHNVLNNFGDNSLKIEYALLKSYDGEQSGTINEIQFPKEEVFKNKEIFIFDDIIDTGETMKYVIEKLKNIGVKSINVCVLCKREGNKMDTWNSPLIIDKGKWLVGCGMDHFHEGRNLNTIYEKI